MPRGAAESHAPGRWARSTRNAPGGAAVSAASRSPVCGSSAVQLWGSSMPSSASVAPPRSITWHPFCTNTWPASRQPRITSLSPV